MIDWLIQGDSFSSCNCDHACPCQFEGLPTHGACEAVETFRVERGHFGDVDLAGVVASVFYAWPGAVFEGKGQMQIVVDDSASEAQRDAIERICKGEETREAANHWWVFHAMSDTVHPTLSKPIEFTTDMQKREARVSIPGLIEASGEPICNPIDGAPHRVRIQCPEGIEFETAEIGNANCETSGVIKLSFKDTYGQFNYLDHTGNGPSHVCAAAM